MNPLEIPEIVIRRLPLYLRTLELMAEQGQEVTSSQELGTRLGISSTQIRKDLSYFGEFGKQGTGYNVAHLQKQLRQILQVDRIWKVALVGAGNLGRAILRFGGFEERGFSIVVVFDKDAHKIGRPLESLRIMDIAQLQSVIRSEHIQIAIIAVPASEAQGVANALVSAGIKALLSYAPAVLTLPSHIRVVQLDPLAALQSMTYFITPTAA